MLNGNIRQTPTQHAATLTTDNNRPYSWTSTTSTISSNSNFNKSEPVFRLKDDLSAPVFTNKNPLQLSWRNPLKEMSGELRSPIKYRSSSSTMSDHETWDEEEDSEGSRMYPIRSGDMATTSFGSRDPYSVSSDELMETTFDSRSGPIRTLTGRSKTGSSDTSWLEDKLAKDLSSIMPNFEFSNSSFKRLSDRPMFSSSSDSETSSDESQNLSYCSSPDFEPRFPRHSWASNLDIIDSETETFDRSTDQGSKRPRRDRSRSRRNSFDNSFRYRKPSSEKGTLRRNQNQNRNEVQDNQLTYLRFESQTKCNHNEKGLPVLKRLVKSSSNSSELIIEGDRLVLKFKRRKDYLCSSAKSKKRKVVLHLLDVVNVLVFTGSSTLVIQFKESTKTRQIKERTTLMDRLSDTLRSSKSNSLSRSTRSTYSDGDTELSELEVGRFHNCKELAVLILKQRQSLIPKGILKRGGSSKTRPVEPIIIRPSKIGVSPSPIEDLIECLTYV